MACQDLLSLLYEIKMLAKYLENPVEFANVFLQVYCHLMRLGYITTRHRE